MTFLHHLTLIREQMSLRYVPLNVPFLITLIGVSFEPKSTFYKH